MAPYRRNYRNNAVWGARGAAATAVLAALPYARKALSYSSKSKKPVSRKPKVKSYKSASKSTAKLRSEVKVLSKKVNGTLATYIKKYRSYAAVRSSGTDICGYESISFAGIGVLEAVIDAVKYYDPTAPTTLVTANLLTGAYKKSVQFKKMYFSCLAKNNYVVPCYVDIYILAPKADTSITAEIAMANSLTDTSNALYTSPLIYPSDCYQMMDIWRIVKHVRRFLAPGAQYELTYSHNKSIQYDPSLVDSEVAEYQKRYGGYTGLIRVSGTLGHDSVNANVTFQKAGVDTTWTRIHTVTYDAGIDTTYIEVDDNPGTITNTLQTTNMDTQQETYGL